MKAFEGTAQGEQVRMRAGDLYIRKRAGDEHDTDVLCIVTHRTQAKL